MSLCMHACMHACTYVHTHVHNYAFTPRAVMAFTFGFTVYIFRLLLGAGVQGLEIYRQRLHRQCFINRKP